MSNATSATLEQPDAGSGHDGRRAGRNVELGQDVGDMAVDGAPADIKLVGDAPGRSRRAPPGAAPLVSRRVNMLGARRARPRAVICPDLPAVVRLGASGSEAGWAWVRWRRVRRVAILCSTGWETDRVTVGSFRLTRFGVSGSGVGCGVAAVPVWSLGWSGLDHYLRICNQRTAAPASVAANFLAGPVSIREHALSA